MNTQTQFTNILASSDLPDYAFLSSKDALENYEEALNNELQKAKDIFETILKKDSQSFEDIVEPFLAGDRNLHILYTFLHNINSTDSSDTTRNIIQNFQPKYVDYTNIVSLSPEFYQKLKQVKAKNKDQQRSLDLLVQGMEISGVHLEGEKKKRLEEVNKLRSNLAEKFSNNTIDSRKQFFHHLESDESIQDMPEQDKQEAAEEAKSRDLEGWVFTLSAPSYQAIMKYCSDRDLRKKFFLAFNSIATEGDFDNRPLVIETLSLRQEKAQLVGKKDYAEYILQERMAKDSTEVLTVIESVIAKSKIKAEKDIEELKTFSGLEDFSLWDSGYYSEKLMKEKFNIDDKELKKYFPLDQALSGLFKIVNRLYGVEMKQIEVKSYHEEVQTFEVWRNGEKIALFLLDLFARKSKRGGAWCNDLRQRLVTKDGVEIPIVINVCNFGKSTGGKPTLLTHYDVQTLFHEFGHALHVMLGKNQYNNLSGFSTEWDFVELPSQILENWCWEKESLELFAKHYQTGEVLPDEMLQSLKKSRTFMSGNFVLRQNEFAMLDIKLHTESIPETVEELDQKCLDIAQEYSVLKKPDSYKMYAAFSHIFAGGYAYGYYSYLWAELLEADAFQAFKKAGIFNKEIGEKFRETILSAGTSAPAAELFRNFMGRDVDVQAYLEKQGLA